MLVPSWAGSPHCPSPPHPRFLIQPVHRVKGELLPHVPSHSRPREAESSGVPFKVLWDRESLCPHRTNQNKTQTHSPSEQPVMQADSVAPSACGVTGERTGGAVREVRPACAGGGEVVPRLVTVAGQVEPAALAHIVILLVKVVVSLLWSDQGHVTENLCPLKSQTDCQKLLCETASVRMERPLWSGSGDHLCRKASPVQAQSLGAGSCEQLSPSAGSRLLTKQGPVSPPWSRPGASSFTYTLLSLSPAGSRLFLWGWLAMCL